jgi:hypothetical protein
MKRIVNGVTYNTDTSTALAHSSWENDDGQVEGTLYQTRGGAFFVDEETTRSIWNEREREHETKVVNSFIPMSAEQAHKWMMEGEVEIFSNPFEDPPEAAAENDPGATIYMRVPASLKKRVEEAAGASKLSGNVWAMRCVERCLEEKSLKPLAFIWWIAWELSGRWRGEEVGEQPELDAARLRKAISALDKITQLAQDTAHFIGEDEPQIFVDEHFKGDPEFEKIKKAFVV